MATTDRCPNFGALVIPYAEWCGQCYQPLRRDEPAKVPGAIGAPRERTTGAVETRGGGGLEFADGHATWTCPVCGETNDLEVSVCTICGTQFARLFVEPEEPPKLDPERAAIWSLVLPGLGHWKLGRKGDAIARFVLFGWSFGTLCVLIASRIGKGGLGSTAALFALFASASFAIYALSVLDAYRIAKGEDPVVSTRMLLWGSAALVVLSTLIATLITLPAARR